MTLGFLCPSQDARVPAYYTREQGPKPIQAHQSFVITPEDASRLIKVASSSTEITMIPFFSPYRTKTRISRPPEIFVHLSRYGLFPLAVFVEMNPIALLRYKGSDCLARAVSSYLWYPVDLSRLAILMPCNHSPLM